MSVSDHEALALELEELLQFVYLMPTGVIKFGPDGEIALLNPRAVQLLSATAIPLVNAASVLGAMDAELLQDWHASMHATGEIGPPRRVVLHAPPGVESARDAVILQLRLVRPDTRCSMLLLEDVTELVARDRELHRHEARLSAMMQHIYGYAVLTLDPRGNLAEWNPSIERQLGHGAEITGTPLHDILGSADGESTPVLDAAPLPSFAVMQERVQQSGWFRFKATARHASGAQRWLDAVLTPMVEPDGEVTGYVFVARDVTNEQRRVEQLYQEAYTDPLTRLPNRRALTERARLLLARDPFAPWCVVLLDIDHFKRVNDTWGHDAGDLVLQGVAEALTRVVRQGDVVGRLGGEEFVLLLDQLAPGAVDATLERIRLAVEQTVIATPQGPLQVTASFGAAVVTRVDEWEALLKRADLAVYAAKAGGRNRVVRATDAEST